MARDDNGELLINIEEQRAYLQQLLRGSHCALLIVIDESGELVTGYMNLNPIERRGMIDTLMDTKPRFFRVIDDED